MAPGNKLGGKLPRSPRHGSRRSFVKGLGAAGVALPALAMLPQWGFAEDAAAPYASAAIDWKQFAGQTITLAGAIHPWSNAITPLLPDFTRLTGINVVTDFRLETTYMGALPIQLTRGDSTPDVLMYTRYGQGVSGGWFEPLNAYYSDKSLTDLAWYDENDLLKTARSFPVWRNGERYASADYLRGGDVVHQRRSAGSQKPARSPDLRRTARHRQGGQDQRDVGNRHARAGQRQFFGAGHELRALVWRGHGQGRQGRFRQPRGDRGRRDVRDNC